MKSISTLILGLAAIVTLWALPSSAMASTSPYLSKISLGETNLCLTAYPATKAVTMQPCKGDNKRQLWIVNGLHIRLWNSQFKLMLTDGMAVLKRGPARSWTYGPSHEITTSIPAGTAFLTWANGALSVQVEPGAGQDFYIFGMGI